MKLSVSYRVSACSIPPTFAHLTCVFLIKPSDNLTSISKLRSCSANRPGNGNSHAAGAQGRGRGCSSGSMPHATMIQKGRLNLLSSKIRSAAKCGYPLQQIFTVFHNLVW